MRRLLLLSNSTNHGGAYLDHAMDAIGAFLGPVRRLCFVPFALRDQEGYAARARERFARAGIEVRTVTADAAGAAALETAEAVFVGGGNTFRLLKTLQDLGLSDAIRRRVQGGMPYVGSSAGSIVAGPTLKTTKDMPIVQPASFDALGLVEFQISPHYLDPDPSSTHMGETQEERILQFLEENDAPVLGLREGGLARVEGAEVRVGGAPSARIFRRGAAPVEVAPGTRLDRLLRGTAP